MESFLEQQHSERDHLFAEVATLTVDSVSVADDVEKVMLILDSVG